MQAIYQQFARPKGLLGRLVGWVMSIENRGRIEWVVNHLNAQPTDAILEIGYGPGLAIEKLSNIVTQGMIGGVDHSDVMLRQATERNMDGVQSGQINLKQGTSTAIPFDDRTFDIVFAINSYHIWNDKSAALPEIKRVLKPDGCWIIAEEPPVRVPEEAEIRERGDAIIAELHSAGFAIQSAEYEDLSRGWATLITAIVAD